MLDAENPDYRPGALLDVQLRAEKDPRVALLQPAGLDLVRE